MIPENKLIVYGGAFNPPTPAHISAIRELSSLDGRLVLLPSGAEFVRKWKPGQQVLPDIARVELLKKALAGAGIQNATVDCQAMVENLCTYDALARLKEKYSAAEAWFVIGEDKLEELPRWAHARELVRYTRFVLVNYTKSGEDELDIPGLEDRVRVFYVKLPPGTERIHATDIRMDMRAHAPSALQTDAGRYMAAHPQCLRLCACAPVAHPGDPEKNADAIIECMNGIDGDILAFPELSIAGYTCGDLLLRDSFLDACERAAAKVAAATGATGQLVFFGCPVRAGGGVYDCAVAAFGGAVLAIVPKRHSDGRWFSSGADAGADTVAFAGGEVPFGVDILLRSAQGGAVVGLEIGEETDESVPPGMRHCLAGANIIVNLSSGGDFVSKADCRRDMLRMLSARGACACVYASCGAGKSAPDLAFDGEKIVAFNGVVLPGAAQQAGSDGTCITADIDLSMLEPDRLRMGRFAGVGDGVRSVTYDQITFRFPTRNMILPFLPGDGMIAEESSGGQLRDFFMFIHSRYGFDREKLRIMAAEAFGACRIAEIDEALDTFFARFSAEAFSMGDMCPPVDCGGNSLD